MAKVKKGDSVIVTTGKDKGRRGEVKQLYPNGYALVEGINIIKKHVKPIPQKEIQGGIVEKEKPIHISNIAIVNSVTGKADRIGFKLLEDGTKVRIYKSNNENIDVKA